MTLKGKLFAWGLLALTALGLLELKARADYDVTVGSGTTIFAFTCFTTKVCPAHVLIDDSGTEIGSSILAAVQGAIPAGTNLIGKVGIDQTTPGTTNAVAIDQSTSGTTNLVTLGAAATGGCTPAKTLSAANNNSTSVKGSAGTLCAMSFFNTTTTVYYLKLYNKATAPTCGTDTPLQTIPVPPASAAGQIGGVVPSTGTFGQAYSLGIGFCLVANFADNDNTSAATGVLINYSYK